MRLLRVSCFFFAIAAALVAEEVRRSFPVQPGATLTLESFRGRVTVREADAAEIAVSVRIDVSAGTEARATRMRENLLLSIEPDGNGVKVSARNRRAVQIQLSEEDRIDLAFEIDVPRTCDVNLKLREAAVTVGHLAGRMSAEIDNGTVFFRRIDGSIDVRLGFGELVVSRCRGPLTGRVRRGSIRVGTIEGPLDLRNDSGDIEIMTALAAATAHAEAGGISVGFPPTVAHGSRITTSGGGIKAQIHREANCRVQASSVWGRVRAEVPLQIEAGENGSRRLTGALNRGGPTIVLRANGGDVTIGHDVMLIDEAATK